MYAQNQPALATGVKEMKERELQDTQEKLEASERFVSELQQSLQQKDKTIADLQQTISDHERKIRQLETGDRAKRPPTTAASHNTTGKCGCS